MRRKYVVPLALAVGMVLASPLLTGLEGRAGACSIQGLTEHEIDTSSTDRTAPTVTTARVVDVKRGQGPQKNGCAGGTTASSCDDIGAISIGVLGSDDKTPPEYLGWSLELDSGALPEGLVLPSRPVR